MNAHDIPARPPDEGDRLLELVLGLMDKWICILAAAICGKAQHRAENLLSYVAQRAGYKRETTA